MTYIQNLPEFKKEEIEKFQAIGIKRLDDIWNRIGTHFDNGISDLAKQVCIDPQRLIELLISQFRNGKDISEDFWVKRHWFGIATFMGTIVLIILAWGTLSAFISPDKIMKNVVINGDAELPPYHVIDASDIRLKEAPYEPGYFLAEKDVIGRYALKSILQGEPLREDQLSKVHILHSDLKAHFLLSVPLQAGTVSPSIQQGSHASLLLSPSDSDMKTSAPLLVKDVMVLSLKKKADTTVAVVAIPAEESEDVMPRMNTSTVFLLDIIP